MQRIKSAFVKGLACSAVFLLFSPCVSLAAAAGGSSPAQGSQAGAPEKAMQPKDGRPAEDAKASEGQKSGRMTWSELEAGKNARPQAQPYLQRDPRADALQGSPESGYAGTWTDPATGDIITSVIGPTRPQSQTDSWPIIVEPQVSPDGYGHNPGGWQNGWPQWPGYMGEPGYGTMPPPNAWPQNGVRPGFRPGNFPQPAPDYRPNYPNYPDRPFNPAYRPLRPNMPPSGPGQPQNPGGIWRPGMDPRPQFPNQGWQGGHWPSGSGSHSGNGFMPSPPPGWQQLPMRPAGRDGSSGRHSGWGHSGREFGAPAILPGTGGF